MNHFLNGFAHEIVKTAGALKSIGRLATKHPILALSAGGTIAAAGMSAAGAYREGLRGGEKPRYLAAGVDPYSGEASASPAAYTNYNELFERPATTKQVKSLSKSYREGAFKR